MRQLYLAMIILDDINLVLHRNYLAIDPVLLQLRQRNPALTVVLTGRYAPCELIDMADRCIEMRGKKRRVHPVRYAKLDCKKW
jgi:cob(I)alamin adenosyltransferase